MHSFQTNVIAIDGSNIFAGTEKNGVFRSTDNGNSWISVNYGLTNYNIRALAICGSTIFAATYDCGIFQSTDNGDSWIPNKL
jgi:photosystem II stability/assembly factor-like uncharacterized protein